MLDKEIESALTTLESQLNEINEMLKEVSDDIYKVDFLNTLFLLHIKKMQKLEN